MQSHAGFGVALTGSPSQGAKRVTPQGTRVANAREILSWSKGREAMDRVVDCFCASGGLTTGLSWAGLDVRMGLDIDEHALAVYRANHPKHAAVALDLSETERAARVIREGVGGTVEVLAGSPPCTDFSSAGSRTERTSVAGLTVDFARLAAMLRPRVCVLENVPKTQATAVI